MMMGDKASAPPYAPAIIQNRMPKNCIGNVQVAGHITMAEKELLSISREGKKTGVAAYATLVATCCQHRVQVVHHLPGRNT